METWYKAVLITVLAVATLIGILAGRSQPTQSAPAFPAPAATLAPSPATGQIDILARSFNPSNAIVRVGQKVTWINRDSRPHGPVADNSTFSSDALNPGQRFTWTPSKVGTYTYADFIDSNLHGVIVVRP